MIELRYPKQFRPLQKLPFCYLCGRIFEVGDRKNKDHVPPEAIFAPRDRDPLQLPTHYDCNHAHHLNDEKVGQLIGSMHGRAPSAKNGRLKFEHFLREAMSALTNLDIELATFRWVMGFHAALYRKPMPRDARAEIFSPLHRAYRWAGREPIVMPTPPEYHHIISALEINKEKSNIDRISCNHGSLLYECVWLRTQNNHHLCLFVLDIYGWQVLSAPQFGQRTCAGSYILLSTSPPKHAAMGESSFSDYDLVHGA